MATKVLTFLGTQAREAEYAFEGSTYKGLAFAEALAQFATFDSAVIFLTIKAKEDAWPKLERLHTDSRFKPVDIPTGETTAEMWEIFQIVVGEVEEGDNVIFDITHGLRSLPFLVFLFAAYLKQARNVTIAAIYYGALELAQGKNNAPTAASAPPPTETTTGVGELARDNNKITPVIVLTDFVQMLDWLTATSQFTETGDARRLAALMRTSGTPNGAAQKASELIHEISLAAALCQPYRLMPLAADLGPQLDKAREELAVSAPPFALLETRIASSFTPFAGPADAQRKIPSDAKMREILGVHYRLVEWYFGNNQLTQAVTLAREWLVSAVTYRLGRPVDLNRKGRQSMEHAVSGIARIGREDFSLDDLNRPASELYNQLVNAERVRLTQLWTKLTSVRNTLDHAGFQEDAPKLKSLIKNADNARQLLSEIAREWELT